MPATCSRSATRAGSRASASSPHPKGWPASRQSGLVDELVVAALDDHLDERAFIVPGLGDAGDRLYGTA